MKAESHLLIFWVVDFFPGRRQRKCKERFLSFTGQQYTPVTFGTFSMACFMEYLKQAYGFTAANILSDEEKFGILRELTLNYGGDLAEEGDFPEEIAREISVVKGNKIDTGTLLFFMLSG